MNKKKNKRKKQKNTFLKNNYVLFVSILLLVIILSLIFFFQNQKTETVFFEIETGFKGRTMQSLYDVDDLLNEMKNSKFVLLGESTHGTKEYYLIRKHISKELIKNHDFNFIAVEGDWASIYELNKYVKNLEGAKKSGREAMNSLNRWPQWMWRNEIILELIEWLRRYNEGLSSENKIGFYGVDVYSPEESYVLLVEFFQKRNLELDELRELDNCLSSFNYDFNNYPSFVYQNNDTCEKEMNYVLKVIKNADLSDKDFFVINQKINVLINAEKHYRKRTRQNYDSWNARASHFALTAENIANYYGEDSKGIIWAHNTHVGDTSFVLGAENMLNIGRILRPKHEVFILGFVKNTGKVSAGRSWGSSMEVMNVPEAKPNSYGRLISNKGHEKALFLFDENREKVNVRGHRAIGVTYNPLNELGNYVPTIISKRYDAIIFLEETTELHSLN